MRVLKSEGADSMSIRVGLLRALYACPRFKGRDRLIGLVASTFSERPREIANGYKMYLDPTEYGQLELLVFGSIEPMTLGLIDQLVAGGDIVIDVGAHLGTHSLRAARASGPLGRVYAFDPQPANIDLVCRNANANNLQNIVAVCGAVGARNGFIQLNLQRETDRSRLSLRLRNPNDLPIPFEVPIRRLDSFLVANSIDNVALLKIDTEGYELEVLGGLGEQITNCRNIILEMLEGDGGDDRVAICDLLSAAGFELHRVDGIAWRIGDPLLESNVWAKRPSRQ
jgi:FkbM family methyltransferase